MTGEQEAIGRLVRRLEQLAIPYMIAGSVASSHHGLPRATNDADVVIDPSPQALDDLVAALTADGYYVDATTPERQLDDVAGILQVSGPRLDRAYLDRWAKDLGVSDLLQRIIGNVPGRME